MNTLTHRNLADVPIAVVDVETTGLHPQGDRIVEIAVVRIEPGGSPRVVLDTLVNPRRRMAATEIHGITDDDVADAPTFEAIAPDVAEALSGAVFASFNVYFDAKFVSSELDRSKTCAFPPHLCLMYLRPGLGLGKRGTLSDTCASFGVPHSNAHFAADDAEASARLWIIYLKRMHELGLRTFSDLEGELSYKFVQSFRDPLIDVVRIDNRRGPCKSRRLARSDRGMPDAAAKVVNPVAEYWDALKSALADASISRDELRYLEVKKAELGISESAARALHARAFIGLLAQISDDEAVDEAEVARVAQMANALRSIGWTPGDAIPGAPPKKQGILARLFQ